MTIAGMDDIPSDLAASSRPCPAMSMLFSSIRTGAAKPTAWILAAICRICFFECVRAFLGCGLIWSMGTIVWVCDMIFSVPEHARQRAMPIRQSKLQRWVIKRSVNSMRDTPHIDLLRVAGSTLATTTRASVRHPACTDVVGFSICCQLQKAFRRLELGHSPRGITVSR